MTTRAFNSVQGFSVGQNPQQDVILANGDITTVNFTANGVSDLGPIGNVRISGGSSGQVIQTDGLGNLVFADTSGGNSAAPMPYYVESGNSYIVPDNFQGLFSQPITIDGTFEVDGILIQVTDSIYAENGQILYDYNGTPTGNTGFSFDPSSGNLLVPGNGVYSGNLLPSVNVTYDLGSPTKRWRDLYLSNNTIYLGDSTISSTAAGVSITNADGGELIVTGNGIATTSSISNGNSNVTINTTDITFSVNSVANVIVVTDLDTTVNGNVITTGIVTDNYYYANGQPLDMGGQPGGANTQVQFNNQGEFGASANFTFDTSNNVLSVNGNISSDYLISTEGCITLGVGAIAVSGTSAGIFNSTVTDISIGLAGNVTIGSLTSVVSVRNDLSATGNISGNLITGTLVTGAQPNVTSVGTLTNLTVSGNINTGNITVTNTVDAVNVKVTDLFSKRTSINITTDTPIDTFPTSSFRSAKYTMRAGDGVDYQALEVLLVHNDINSIITVYGSLSTSGTDLVAFTTDVSAGNVNVYATAVGPNTNLNLMGTYVPD